MSELSEKRVYYVVLGGDKPGIYFERPRNVAEGCHFDLLPIVVTLLGYSEAKKVNELNMKIFAKLEDRNPDDPAEILAALKDSRTVSRLCANRKLKIYALKVAKLTGIWYGLDWNKDVGRLTKYKGAEFKGFDTFKEAVKWMLDKDHLIAQGDLTDELDGGFDDNDNDDDDNDANYWANYPRPPSPPPEAAFLDAFGESVSRPASPTKQPRREASPTKQLGSRVMITLQVAPPLSPTKEKRAPSRACSPTKGSAFGAPQIERSASVPPAYVSTARPSASASVRFAPPQASVSSIHGNPHAAGQSITAQVGSLFRHEKVVAVSDDETFQEATPPRVPTANELRRILLPPVFGHDEKLVADSNAITLGARADAWLDGRRIPPSHRILVLQAYVSSDSTDIFTHAVSREPLNVTVADAENLWIYISRLIPPF